jgi:hypothetical protein
LARVDRRSTAIADPRSVLYSARVSTYSNVAVVTKP